MPFKVKSSANVTVPTLSESPIMLPVTVVVPLIAKVELVSRLMVAASIL